MSERKERPFRRERPSFIWPILLVVVGGIFLLSNLGLFGSAQWGSLWRLWPVILIAIGLDSLFRRNEIAGPVFMIVLGSIFLMSSLGLIGWESWDMLWRLWPVLLVAVGIEILIGRRSLWLSLLATVAIVGVLGVVIFRIGGVGFVTGTPLTHESIQQVLEDIDRAEVSLRPAVGRLDVSGDSQSTDLVSGSFQADRFENVYADYTVEGRTGHFVMRSQPMVNFPGNRGWDWELVLNGGLPLDLELAMGVGEMNADLANLDLEKLDVSQGVGDIDLILAGGGDYSGDVSQAIGQVVVRIPSDVGVRLQVSRAISSLDIPAGFERDGDFYYSPNYESTDYKVDLEISQAIGSVEVRMLP
jgi:hypothetical protein